MPEPYPQMDSISPGPARNAAAVVPSDSADLPIAGRAIYVTNEGDITGIPSGQSASITFTNVARGILPVSFKRILATGTSASGLINLW